MKVLTGIPMTVLVDLAICEFLESYGVSISGEETTNENGERAGQRE